MTNERLRRTEKSKKYLGFLKRVGNPGTCKSRAVLSCQLGEDETKGD
jgi:hypothetical protein